MQHLKEQLAKATEQQNALQNEVRQLQQQLNEAKVTFILLFLILDTYLYYREVLLSFFIDYFLVCIHMLTCRSLIIARWTLTRPS